MRRCLSTAKCVRICANKVVACVRCSTLLPDIRAQDARQSAPAQQIDQLEGLAVAIPWGSESPFRTNLRSRLRAKVAPQRCRQADERCWQSARLL